MTPLWRKRWLIFAFALGALMLLMPTPTGLSFEGWAVLTMTVVAVILFITEPVPLPTVALLIIVGQVFLLGLTSTTVARSLMNDSVLFIMGSLMIAVALVKQRLDKRLAFLIVRLTGTKTFNICLGISLASGLMAAVIGEHTVAAMMLPVAITLVKLTAEDGEDVRPLAAMLLLSIAYGCSIAGIATPSGGARNAIMINYWRELFYDPSDPETSRYLVGYLGWAAVTYPLFLVQVPFLTLVLFFTFRPQQRNMARAAARLRLQIARDGTMQGSHYLTIAIFLGVLVAWVLFSDTIGLGTVAVLGAALFLILGLVRWEDYNGGVNWGVVLLYAAMISIGLQMSETGAALWVADTFLSVIAPFGGDEGLGLYASVVALTAVVGNTMSAAAAVAVLGPITLNLAVSAGESPLIVGYLTAVSSAFAYMTVIGTPAATIVYSAGYLKPGDFLSAGWKMMLLSATFLLLFSVLYWPLLL